MQEIQYIVVWMGLGAFIFYFLTRYIRKIKLKTRMKKARKGELKAIELLQRNGYEILDAQKQKQYNMTVDNKKYQISVKADMIVKKGKKIYVAEVKTGEKAPSANLPATRRQLLEYFLVYKPDGIILVDMENQILKKVEYSIINGQKLQNILLKCLRFLIILLCGVVIGFLTRGD